MKPKDDMYNELEELFSGLTDREQLEVLQLVSDLVHGKEESNPLYQRYLEKLKTQETE